MIVMVLEKSNFIIEYDEKLKFWRLDTLPFMPKEYKYEIIPTV